MVDNGVMYRLLMSIMVALDLYKVHSHSHALLSQLTFRKPRGWAFVAPIFSSLVTLMRVSFLSKKNLKTCCRRWFHDQVLMNSLA